MARRLKRRKLALWRFNPHCELCGIKTILSDVLIARYNLTDGGKLTGVCTTEELHQLATVDHLFSRFDPRRNNPLTDPTLPKIRTRLLCWKCNSERGTAEQREINKSGKKEYFQINRATRKNLGRKLGELLSEGI